jgi:CubicO group peptidase (beta-lactamase class C family)
LLAENNKQSSSIKKIKGDKTMKTGIFILILIFLMASPVITGTCATWPTESWQISTPEEQGMDSKLLTEGLDFLQEHREEYHIHSLTIIRHGYIVADVYFYPFAPGMMHDLASVTKSFTATLIGIAIDEGYIESVEQAVLDLFPERTVANDSADKRAMTIENLLTMRSGFECFSEDEAGMVGGGTQAEMVGSPDWVQFTLDLPLSDKPGERFNYCNSNPHLLSGILREHTELSALAFAQKYLFGPLGISNTYWPSDPQENNHGWGDMYLTPRDMAKLGYLYLHKGLWDNRQVLSPAWVTAATSFQTNTHLSFADYGYLWWLKPSGEYYYADGREGQRIFVFADKDMVVVTTGGGGRDQYKVLETLLTSYIIPAVESEIPLPANPKGVALQESRIKQTAVPLDIKPVPPLSNIAQTVSGKTYVMDVNPLGVSGISLSFQDESEALCLVSLGDFYQFEILIGLDNVFRFSSGYPRNPGLPAAAKGVWESDNIFLAEYDTIGNLDRWKWKFIFKDNQVTLQMSEITQKQEITITGKIEG